MKKTNLIILIVFSALTLSGQHVALDWAGSLGGSGDDRGNAMVTDPAGNCYTTGSFEGSADFDPGPGQYILTSQGQDDIYVQKSDKNGNFIRAISMGGAGDQDRGESIAIDNNDHIYVTGSFEGTVDFDPGPGSHFLTSHGGSDFFVLKLDADANFVWAVNIGGEGYEYSRFITTDHSGGVIITGSMNSFSADFDPGPGTHFLSMTEGVIFILKLDSAANFIWAKNMGGMISTDYFTWGRSVCLDNQQNIYATGVFGGVSDFDPGNGTYNLTSHGNNDAFILKLDVNGNFIWAKNVGSTGDDRGESIKTDLSGNLYICGSFRNTADFDPGPADFELTSEGQSDIFILKLDASGNFIWARSMGSWDYDYANSLAIDAYNDIYITGGFNETVDFDPNSGVYNLTSFGSHDVFVEKTGASGNFLWAVQMGGTSYDVGNSLAIDNTGSLYLAGTFYGLADFDPNETNFFLTGNGSGEIFLSKLENLTLGVSEPGKSNLRLYPNPCHGTIYLRNSGTVSDISVYDMTGRKMAEEKAPVNEIDLKSLTRGMYIAVISTRNDGRFYEKIIVE